MLIDTYIQIHSTILYTNYMYINKEIQIIIIIPRYYLHNDKYQFTYNNHHDHH